MDIQDNERLTDAELRAFMDALFPHGLAGADVLGEIAPEGWEQSPLLACFHPSLEQVFQERVRVHRNIESLRARWWRDVASRRDEASSPEPTFEDVRGEYRPELVRPDDELHELMGLCLWDVFSDGHVVIAADSRAVDIGSFRAAAVFLEEYVRGDTRPACRRDFPRFCFGTNLIGNRADLTGVHMMIFHRLGSLGADWVYRLRAYGPADFGSWRRTRESAGRHPRTQVVPDHLRQREREKMVEWFRAEFGADTARAVKELVNRPPPATVRAYREVYRRDPCGWPPF
jgi:hypothetical protein